MFEVTVKTSFSAAHRVRGHQGACANLHGHNWDVEVALCGEALDETGFLLDFGDVKAAVRDVAAALDHADLNALEPFGRVNPTSENLAQYLFRALAARLDSARCRVSSVRVSESAGTSAAYREDRAGR